MQYAILKKRPDLRPTSCRVCDKTISKTTGIVPHLEDYSQPIQGIIGLCHRCHTMIHERFRYPEKFERYRAMIADGWNFTTPPKQGHWLLVLRDMCQSDRAFKEAVQDRPPRGATWLDTLDASWQPSSTPTNT